MNFRGSGTQLETMSEEPIDSTQSNTNRNDSTKESPKKETTPDSPVKNEERALETLPKEENAADKMANAQSPAQKEAAKESQMHETFHGASTGSPSDAQKDEALAKETGQQTDHTAVRRSTHLSDGENEKSETKEPAKQEVFPGDELIPDAVMVYDQKRTIRAPARDIFPWLLQLGRNRGGWYLPNRLEGILPATWRPSRTIEPKWQKLTPGERIADYGFTRNDYFVVDRVIEPYTIVLRSKRQGSQFTWAFLLRELHESDEASEPATVVHLRFRGELTAEGIRRKILVKSGELLDKASAAPMLAGLAERCEQPGQLETGDSEKEKPARRSFAGLSSRSKPVRQDSSESPPKEESKAKRRSFAGLSPFSRSTSKGEAAATKGETAPAKEETKVPKEETEPARETVAQA